MKLQIKGIVGSKSDVTPVLKVDASLAMQLAQSDDWYDDYMIDRDEEGSSEIQSRSEFVSMSLSDKTEFVTHLLNCKLSGNSRKIVEEVSRRMPGFSNSVIVESVEAARLALNLLANDFMGKSSILKEDKEAVILPLSIGFILHLKGVCKYDSIDGPEIAYAMKEV